MNQYLMGMPSLLDTLDYNSPHQLASVLKHYAELREVALKGYPAVMELYVELELALSKMPNKQQIMKDILEENDEQLYQHATQLSKVLENMG